MARQLIAAEDAFVTVRTRFLLGVLLALAAGSFGSLLAATLGTPTFALVSVAVGRG